PRPPEAPATPTRSSARRSRSRRRCSRTTTSASASSPRAATTCSTTRSTSAGTSSRSSARRSRSATPPPRPPRPDRQFRTRSAVPAEIGTCTCRSRRELPISVFPSPRTHARSRTVRFQVLDIVFNPPHPVTGEAVAPSDRLNRVIETAVLAEELGFDSFAVGERHAGDVLSSAPTVILGAIAARTSRILLSTGVTVLSLRDRRRVAEDLATVDQRSRGRREIVIGKGNEVLQYPLLGLDIDKQYEYLQENYELLRLLLSEEDVSWTGRHRHALEHATTLPRPFAGPFRIWHGSATSRFAVELAARYGDPVVSANALQPRENYQVLIDHYRERYAAHGHDPAYAFVGAGSGGLFLADTTEEAVEQYRPIYEGQVAAAARRG